MGWNHLSIGTGGLGWAACVAAGFLSLYQHAGKPGQPGAPPARLPKTSTLFPRDRHLLVLFAHPRCPCTRATVAELARLMARCRGRLVARVYLYRPAGTDATWGGTSLREAAETIPGVLTLDDEGAEGASRFGVETSGHVILFSPDGSRLFSGGITAARGHEGRNDGVEAVARLVQGSSPAPPGHPVFGCRIRETGAIP